MNLGTTALRTALRGVVCTAAIGAAVVAGTGVSAAQSQTGWVGPTAPIDGVIYLHSSTISDTPQLAASTAIYPSFGQSVPEFRMGVQSRLFGRAITFVQQRCSLSDHTVAVQRDVNFSTRKCDERTLRFRFVQQPWIRPGR